MPRSKDPLTAAVTSYLWPYLKNLGFKKVSPRKYAREASDTIQQLWVDANGFGGKSQTLIILCVNPVYEGQTGYKDPCGFRICNDKTWDMSTHEKADRAMQKVVQALNETELEKLNAISSIEGILESLKDFWRIEWYEKSKELAKRWSSNDPELMQKATENREKYIGR